MAHIGDKIRRRVLVPELPEEPRVVPAEPQRESPVKEPERVPEKQPG